MRRYRNKENDSDLDMTPMLDVVFILLIFFIVTSSIENTMKFDVTLPSASVTEKNEEKNLEIEISADEIILYEGQSYSLEEGYNILLQNGGDMKNLLIYADKDLRTEIFVKIADFAKSNGYKQVALATKEGMQ